MVEKLLKLEVFGHCFDQKLTIHPLVLRVMGKCIVKSLNEQVGEIVCKDSNIFSRRDDRIRLKYQNNNYSQEI